MSQATTKKYFQPQKFYSMNQRKPPNNLEEKGKETTTPSSYCGEEFAQEFRIATTCYERNLYLRRRALGHGKRKIRVWVPAKIIQYITIRAHYYELGYFVGIFQAYGICYLGKYPTHFKLCNNKCGPKIG